MYACFFVCKVASMTRMVTDVIGGRKIHPSNSLEKASATSTNMANLKCLGKMYTIQYIVHVVNCHRQTMIDGSLSATYDYFHNFFPIPGKRNVNTRGDYCRQRRSKICLWGMSRWMKYISNLNSQFYTHKFSRHRIIPVVIIGFLLAAWQQTLKYLAAELIIWKQFYNCWK